MPQKMLVSPVNLVCTSLCVSCTVLDFSHENMDFNLGLCGGSAPAWSLLDLLLKDGTHIVKAQPNQYVIIYYHWAMLQLTLIKTARGAPSIAAFPVLPAASCLREHLVEHVPWREPPPTPRKHQTLSRRAQNCKHPHLQSIYILTSPRHWGLIST